MKQLPPISLQVHLSNHFDLLSGLLKFAEVSRLVLIYPRTKLYFNIIEISLTIFCNEIARCYNGKITKEDNVVIKTLRFETRGVHGVR